MNYKIQVHTYFVPEKVAKMYQDLFSLYLTLVQQVILLICISSRIAENAALFSSAAKPHPFSWKAIMFGKVPIIREIFFTDISGRIVAFSYIIPDERISINCKVSAQRPPQWCGNVLSIPIEVSIRVGFAPSLILCTIKTAYKSVVLDIASC